MKNCLVKSKHNIIITQKVIADVQTHCSAYMLHMFIFINMYTLPAKHTSTTESYYNILVLKLIKIQYFAILTNKIIQSSIYIGK